MHHTLANALSMVESLTEEGIEDDGQDDDKEHDYRDSLRDTCIIVEELHVEVVATQGVGKKEGIVYKTCHDAVAHSGHRLRDVDKLSCNDICC